MVNWKQSIFGGIASMNQQQDPERHDLSDEEYALLARLLPPERPPKAGRPWTSHRQATGGILYILATGSPWRDLPRRYGPFSTVHDHFRRWQKDGTWQKILDTLQARSRKLGRIDFDFGAFDGSSVRAHKAAAGAEKKDERGKPLSPEESQQKQALGVSRGGWGTKIHVLCEGQGKPVTLSVTPGQQAENTQVEVLLDKVLIGGRPGPPRRRFTTLAGDKGYDSAAMRAALRLRRSRPVIAHRRDRQGNYPPGAAGFDQQTYRRRNVVERLIGRLKEYRRIATRYEKLAESFVAMILLGFIRIWLHDLLAYRA
jgi:transposase